MVIVHICPAEKFIDPFIELVNNNFDMNQHLFLVSENKPYKIQRRENVIFIRKEQSWMLKLYILVKNLNKADKIILHGLSNNRLAILLFLQPWLLRKCYWIIWGGDLYKYTQRREDLKWVMGEFVRKAIIKKIGYLVTGTSGDVDLARHWYDAKGQHIKCFNYPSNLFKNHNVKPKQYQTINVQIGNSADPSNNHIDIFNKISMHKSDNINIFVPLSYGDMEYAQNVIKKGQEIFGEKFVPITELMPLNKYIEFLSCIDIAIFAHKRQQAFGNAITLLGFGKKVYMRRKSTLWNVFEEYKIQVFDYESVNVSLLNIPDLEHNKVRVRKYFSKESLIKSLSSWIK